jgi:CRISPR-associated protein Cas8a1/Csx13
MQIEFDLGNPRFTLLHRAGLAGLWMTLKQLDAEKVKAPEGLTWQLTNRNVKLLWEGHDQKILEWLLTESFQLHDGLISLRGLNAKTMRRGSLAIVHQGILGTFLQHNSTHKSLGVRTETLQLGENEKEIQVTYKELFSYAYQAFARNLCDERGKLLVQPISIAGWLNPGAAVRHVAFSTDTSFKEPPECALMLLFAPVACYYYILRSKLRDKRAQYALVIPEIINLEKFAQYKQDVHGRLATYQDFYASGLGDAGLRFLTYETTAGIASDVRVPRCQVVTLGTVAWSTQQKTRTDLYVVEADAQVYHNYQICRNELGNRSLPGKNGSAFVITSFARELIAENLARGQAWYAGFADKVNSNDLFEKLRYERGGLYQMIQKAEWDEEREKLFVQACHQAIRYTYGQLSKNTKSGEQPNWEKVSNRMRSGLGRCKNASSFREFITKFWANAGRIPTLQEHWQDLMDLVMDERQWKKGRDLALLALASYKGQGTNTTDSDAELNNQDEVEDASSEEEGTGLPWM